MPQETKHFRCPVCFAPGTLLYNQWFDDEIVKRIGHPYKGQMIRLKVPYFDWVQLTPDHEVLITPVNHGEKLRVGETKFIPSSQILPVKNKHSQHAVVLPKMVFKSGQFKLDLTQFEKGNHHGILNGHLLLDENISELLGWYAAEGFKSKEDISFSLGKHELENIDRVLHLIKELGYKGNTKEKRTSTVINIGSRLLSRAIPVWCGQGASNKRVPEFLFDSSKSLIASFLNGYSKGDGSYYLRGNKDVLQIKTISERLAKEVQLLYFQLGVRLSLSRIQARKEVIEGRFVNSKTKFSLFGNVDGSPYHPKWQDEHYWYLPVWRKQVVDYDGEVCDAQSASGFLNVPFIIKNCGQHAPIERLYEEKPFPFGLFHKILGGKKPLTESQRELRREEKLRAEFYNLSVPDLRGSAPGVLDYDPIPMEEEVKQQLHVRLEEVIEEGL